MNKKKLIILGIVALILLAVLIAALSRNQTVMSKVNSGSKNITNNSATPSTPAQNGSAPATAGTAGTAGGTSLSSSTAPVIVSTPLSAMPGSTEAPKQETVEVTKVPSKAIKLSVSNDGFTPKEFTVSAGKSVTLAVTSVGDGTHVFLFPNASLMALTMMVSNGETKVITFDAPAAGTYQFRDDIPSFRANVGTMIVK